MATPKSQTYAEKKRGRFITFEGGDATGKTTQIEALSAFLTSRNITHITTREPGGTPFAEALRTILLGDCGRDAHPLTHAILMSAARFEHVQNVIKPALLKGSWVICDRFFDSTTVYQGNAMGVDQEIIQQLHTMVLSGLTPDLTLVFHLKADTALQRGRLRAQNHYDQKDAAFKARVDAGFKKLLQQNPDRCVLIDAAQSVPNLAKTIQQILHKRFF